MVRMNCWSVGGVILGKKAHARALGMQRHQACRSTGHTGARHVMGLVKGSVGQVLKWPGWKSRLRADGERLYLSS